MLSAVGVASGGGEVFGRGVPHVDKGALTAW